MWLMVTILNSEILERQLWLQCAEWITVKSRLEARQPGQKRLQQFKEKKNTLRKKDWYKKYRFDKLSKWLNDKKKLNLEN